MRGAASGDAVAARAARSAASTASSREQQEGIAFLRGEVAVRERILAERVGALREGARTRSASDLRGPRSSTSSTALAELERWETSRLGRLRHAPRTSACRARRRAARRRPARRSSPSARALIPRPLARWLRRVVAPVARPTALVELEPREPRRAPRTTDAVPDGARRPLRRRRLLDHRLGLPLPAPAAARDPVRPPRPPRLLPLDDAVPRRPAAPAWDLARKAERVGELRIRSRRAARRLQRARSTRPTWTSLVESFEALAARPRDGRRGLPRADPLLGAARRAAARAPRLAGRLRLHGRVDELPGLRRRASSRSRRELVRGADATIVSADRLEEKWKGDGAAAHPRAQRDGRRALPRALRAERRCSANVRHPVIGYYGALASWVDVPLLDEDRATRIRTATIVLAGGQFDVDLSPIASRAERAPARPAALRRDAAAALELRRLHHPVPRQRHHRGDEPGQVLRVPLRRQARRRAGADGAAAVRGALVPRPRATRSSSRSSTGRSPSPPTTRAAPRAARVAEENDWAHRYEAIDEGLARRAPARLGRRS